MPLRVHQDVVLTSQMLVEGDDVILLPVATRYEQEGGGTETTTERRIVFCPEIPRQVGEARSEWRLFADVATGCAPTAAPSSPGRQRAPAGRDRPGGAVLRRHRDLADTGDAVQWGGRHLCAGGVFPTPDGRGALQRRWTRRCPSCPRGVHGGHPAGQAVQLDGVAAVDPLTGAGRDAV